jgi:ribonuclease T1
MSKWIRIAIVLIAVVAALDWWSNRGPAGDAPPGPPTVAAAASDYPSFLPPEAVATLQAIERGGPYAYDRDGTVFQNRERLLPEQPRGYYREYTVTTPGSRDRGARRIVTGGNPPQVYYYTDDHYRSFRRVEIDR